MCVNESTCRFGSYGALRIISIFLFLVVTAEKTGAFDVHNTTVKTIVAPNALILSCAVNNVTSIFELYQDTKLVVSAVAGEDGIVLNEIKKGHFEVSGGTDKLSFIMKTTHLDDQGNFTCVSKNKDVTVYKITYEVIIQGAPVVEVDPNTKVLSLFEQVAAEVYCTARGNPKPNINWKKSGKPYVTGSLLKIPRVQFNDSGLYSCVASNTYGIDSKTIQIEVKPLVPGIPNNFTAINVKEKSITLGWSQAADGKTGVERYELETPDLTPGKKTYGRDTRKATIDNLIGFRKYSFTLKACNSYGCGKQASATITTLEQSRPTRPTNVMAYNITKTSITLKWTPGTHSSKPILKNVILYREALATVDLQIDVNSISYTVKNLKPFTTYIFLIKTCITGTSEPLCNTPLPSDYHHYRTSMAAPSQVCCVSVQNTDDESLGIIVSFGPPLNLNAPNGTYKIFYKIKNETKWEVKPLGDGKPYRIRLLQSGESFLCVLNVKHGLTHYDVMINAANLVASSNSSVVRIRTDEPVPGKPKRLRLVSRSWSSLDVAWEPPSDYITSISNYNLILNYENQSRVATLTKKTRLTIKGLKEKTRYKIEVHAVVVRSRDKKSLKSPAISEAFETDIKTAGEASMTLVIVTVICVFVMLVVVIVTLFYCRRKNVFAASRGSTFYVSTETGIRRSFRVSIKKTALPVTVEDFPRYMKQMHADSDYLLCEEFGSLHPRRPGLLYEQSSSYLNKPKNRYPDIVAYDHSRVRLLSIDGVPASNYINANFVDGYKKKNAFIATQGPLTRTFEDFWRMILEQDTRVIIMLTNLVEKGRRKCDQYWPNEGKQHYGTIVVHLTNERKYAYSIIRTFIVFDSSPKDGNDKANKQRLKREIKQFHFTDWPDVDVPRSTILPFIWWIRHYCDQFQTPMVCHCSAGVGRTGTFIVLDAQIRRVDEEKTIDIYGFLRNIRSQRNFLVQRERQYVFIHDALLDYIRSGRTELKCSNLRETVEAESFIGIDRQPKSKLEIEWEAINIDEIPCYELKAGRRPCNVPKNRDQHILPVHDFRVRLTVRGATEDTDYINACYVDTFLDKRSLIVTQSPLQDTIEDFWRMIWENYSVIIINLLSEQDCMKEDYSDYLPKDDCNPINFGLFEVNRLSEVKTGFMIKRELEITNRVPWGESEKRKVYHFQFLHWPEDSYPSPVELLEFMEIVKDKQDQLHLRKGKPYKAPVVIHCSCGVGRSGIYGILSSVKEQLEDPEGVVDVFTSVKITRRQRPYFIQTIEQYQYCYKAAVEFNDRVKRVHAVTDLVEVDKSEPEEKTSSDKVDSITDGTEPLTLDERPFENGNVSYNPDNEKSDLSNLIENSADQDKLEATV